MYILMRSIKMRTNFTFMQVILGRNKFSKSRLKKDMFSSLQLIPYDDEDKD